nr:ribonuclease H-like domain-containing protein [Tanacetum cinerariifolium]
MMMEHYLSHTGYPIWQVIHNGNGLVFVTTDTNGMIKDLPPKTAKEVVAREMKRKVKTTLLMALPKDHLVKFHKMADAKEMWEAIKSRFGGNDESKKMQKYLLKQQFEGFSVSTSEGLHKGYDRFQTFLSQLEIHGAGVLHEDANQKFLRSLPSSWSQINDDDMEKMDLKWQVAMISMRIKKFHKRTGRKLQFDTKDQVGFDKIKVECFNCYKIWHFIRDYRAKGNQDIIRRDAGYNGNKTRDNGRRPAYLDDTKVLVTIDGEDIDWSGHVEENSQNYAMMAYSSSNSGSDNEVKSCSKPCEEYYARLKRLYDEQRYKLGDASVEITAYTLAVKKCRSSVICHQQNQLAYEQKIRPLNTQMSANDKFGLGYGEYRYGSILSYENEVLHSVFMNKASDLEDTPINDRYVDRMHAVPPPMTGDYMPSRPNVEIDYSKFTYGLKQTSADESDSKPSEYAFCESDSSVAMISMRIKKFHKRTGRKLQFDTKDQVGFDKIKVECFNCHKIWYFTRDYRAKGNQDIIRRDVGYNGNKTRDNGRRPAYLDDTKVLVTIDGEDIDWSGHVEENSQNYAMMAYSSSHSGSDNEVKSCSKPCEEYYARLKRLYDEQRYKLGDASVEITAYTLAKLLAEALKEKDDLKTKFENWQNSSKNLSRLLNTQMSANDKFWLGYGEYRYGSFLSYENEVLHNVFMNKASDLEDTPINDRYVDRMHTVPPPMTGDYMPSGPNVEIDYSKFTYGLKQTSADESDSKPSEYAFCESDSSVDTSTSMPELVENAPKVVCEPKEALKDKGIVDSGCSRHMIGNKAHLADYQEFKGGSVAFGGSNGRITSKGKIKADRLDLEDVYYMEELKHYNLFSMSQMYDKKNKVLFANTDCLVLSPDFKFPDKNQLLLKIPRQHNMYSFNLKNIDPFGDLACLFVKALINESNKWHRRLGHVNFKNLNKLVMGNLIRGLSSQIFENDHTCVACQKGKQHKASYSFLPTTFWAEAVNTVCFVINRVLVTKPQNKTPYELLTGKQPIISYLRPFGCHVTILNTIDHLGKFDGKSDSGFLVGYSLNSKAFRMFDLDYPTNSMNYEPISIENQANKSTGPKEANNSVGKQANVDQGANSKEIDLNEEYFVRPIWPAYVKSSGDKIEKT